MVTSSETNRILIVDDAPAVRLVLKESLRSARFEMDEAPDGASAVAMLAKGDYGVVITDLSLAERNGFELLTAVRDLARGIEVILLTDLDAPDTTAATRALRMGAHDILGKPPRSPEHVVLTVERALEKRQLRETQRRLLLHCENAALTDPVTGIPNRVSFEGAFLHELARARRHEDPLGLLVLHIDHPERMNSSHGQAMSEAVLQQFAQVVTGALRKGDSLFRCKDEEFLVILPFAEYVGILLAGERILEQVARAPFTLGALNLRVTASAGAACLGRDEDGSTLLSRAQSALDRAKAGGGNRVCLCGDTAGDH